MQYKTEVGWNKYNRDCICSFDLSVTDESYVDETRASGVINYNPGTFDNCLQQRGIYVCSWPLRWNAINKRYCVQYWTFIRFSEEEPLCYYNCIVCIPFFKVKQNLEIAFLSQNLFKILKKLFTSGSVWYLKNWETFECRFLSVGILAKKKRKFHVSKTMYFAWEFPLLSFNKY